MYPHHFRLAPYTLVLFFVTLLTASVIFVAVEALDTWNARSEIAQSHAVMAQIIDYQVENADYRTYAAQSTQLVRRDRYLFTLAFQDATNQPATAELEWFLGYASSGRPLRHRLPWVGGLEELPHHPWINIYQDLRSPTRVQLASPLNQRANIGLQLYDLMLLSLIVAFLVTLLYGLGYALWSDITKNDKL